MLIFDKNINSQINININKALTGTEDDLFNFINRYLNNPDSEFEGRKKIVDNQCYYNDGNSSDRLLRYIIDFTNQKSV